MLNHILILIDYSKVIISLLTNNDIALKSKELTLSSLLLTTEGLLSRVIILMKDMHTERISTAL